MIYKPKAIIKEKKGFTLIEVIVVISIIGLLATSAILSGTQSKRITSLNRASREVLISLRDAQNKSLITLESSAGLVPCGFGVHYVDENGFLIFKEETSPSGQECVATSTGQNIDRLYQAPGGYGLDVAIENFSFTEANYVKIKEAFPDIYFEPPDGLTYFDGLHDNTVASTTDIAICLRSNCEEFQKTIRVYLGGNIEVID